MSRTDLASHTRLDRVTGPGWPPRRQRSRRSLSGSRPALAAWLAWLPWLCACQGGSGATTTLASQQSPSALPTVDTVDTTAPASEPAPSGDASTQSARCAPWAPSPKTVATRTQAGRGDFFRELHYDFQSGNVRVHDSDPFAGGTEAATPRILDEAKVLTGTTREETEKALLAICADEAALKAACAPGGCSRLTVTHADGSTTVVEHVGTVSAAATVLAPFFPALRTK